MDDNGLDPKKTLEELNDWLEAAPTMRAGTPTSLIYAASVALRLALEHDVQPYPTAWAGLTIHGTTDIVTDNYKLPACTKMVVTWETKTDDNYAFLSVRFVNVQQSQEVGIEDASGTVVNYMGDNLTGGVGRGSVLFPTLGGTYFFEVSNTTGPWTVNFDCQD